LKIDRDVSAALTSILFGLLSLPPHLDIGERVAAGVPHGKELSCFGLSLLAKIDDAVGSESGGDDVRPPRDYIGFELSLNRMLAFIWESERINID
jgi:hypothetical protein